MVKEKTLTQKEKHSIKALILELHGVLAYYQQQLEKFHSLEIMGLMVSQFLLIMVMEYKLDMLIYQKYL